ncbi:hypothetical protein [Mycobacterium sp. NPDC050041]|uniref:hypothetical protein n=1 Tax=Mycobacterium sp. NPDC050041 TaxID=3364293 RepID=UPI003C2F0E70
MTQPDDPSARPKDATEVTDEQREQQQLFDHQGEDPDAPGGHESRRQIADEN